MVFPRNTGVRSLMPEAEPVDDFGADETFLQNVIAPAPAAPAPPAWEPLAGQISQQWQQYGISPDIRGINRANELAQILTNYGITDLSKIGIKETPYEEQVNVGGGGEGASDIWETVTRNRGQLTYGDQTFGRLGGFGSKGQQEFSAPQEYLQQSDPGRYGLGYSAAGKGWTEFEVVKDASGKPVIVPRWGSSSDLDPGLIQVLALAAMPFTGGLSASLAPVVGAAAAPIVSQALISGGLGGLSSAAQGGSFGEGFGKGALTGGLTAGVGQFAAPFASTVGSEVLSATGSQALSDAAAAAVRGGASALPRAVTSGDFDNVLSSALTGGATAGVTSGLSDLTGLSQKDIRQAIDVVRAIEQENPLALAGAASAYLPGPSMPGLFVDENIQEGFFDEGGPGYIEPTTAPAPFFPEFEEPLLTAAPAPTFKPPSDEDYEELESILLRYPEQQIPGVEPKTAMPPQEMARFLEANIEDPGTIDTLMQDYFPELYSQRIEVPGTRDRDFFPEFSQPLLTAEPAPEPIYEQPPTPAPTPAPAPAPAPAPVAAPAAPAKTPAGVDPMWAFLFGMAMTPQQKAEEDYQLAQILGVESPFGRIV